jgi:hypothetical protein
MPNTLNPTCLLCGLRYADRGLLDLHIREDHVHRERNPEPAHDEPATPEVPRPRSGETAADPGQTPPGPRPTQADPTLGWVRVAVNRVKRALR